MIIRVKRSLFGYLMYLFDIIAVVFIGLYLIDPEGFINMGTETTALLIFFFIGISLIMAYLDLGKTTEKAMEVVMQGKKVDDGTTDQTYQADRTK